MKKILFIMIPVIGVLVSCNDFLDTLPDKRAELNTPEKVVRMLVSAYPTELPTLMFEVMSDNIMDNGPLYTPHSTNRQTIIQSYHYQDITDPDWDVPNRVWQRCYISISSANQALAAIEKLGDSYETQVSKAEALLCRAYCHFILATTFCIAYNPVSSETDLGIPYAEEAETTVSPVYTRGTVADVYRKIERDIEDALKIHRDEFQVPAYHFNRKAAYAFAARFYLYYGKWDKVVEYANHVLGDDPTPMLRDHDSYRKKYSNVADRSYAYFSTDEMCNYMVLAQRSHWGRIYERGGRYAHNEKAAYGTFWHRFPGGPIESLKVMNGGAGNTYLYYPKCHELWEVTNITAGTGQAHIVLVPFTGDLLLMARAEAYAMLEEYDKAAQDLSIWYMKNELPAATAQEISDYYSVERSASPRPAMESRFNVQEGMQENLVRAALAVRRLDGVHVGVRWPDIKRHGIVVKHPVLSSQTEADTLTIKPYDSRTAIQLPADVISSGLPRNPRN